MLYYTQCVQNSTYRSPLFTFCHLSEVDRQRRHSIIAGGQKVVLNLRIILRSGWEISKQMFPGFLSASSRLSCLGFLINSKSVESRIPAHLPSIFLYVDMHVSAFHILRIDNNFRKNIETVSLSKYLELLSGAYRYAFHKIMLYPVSCLAFLVYLQCFWIIWYDIHAVFENNFMFKSFLYW